MALDSQEAVRLARYLRSLRESAWSDADLTQAQLAAAFSTESQVGPATISTWESATNPKSPNSDRLRAYARFFATRRSIEGEPGLIPENELTDAEHAEFRRLEHHLLRLSSGTPEERAGETFRFSDGPVTIICPNAPTYTQGSLAKEKDPNFTKLLQYADLDALIEIHGHVRAVNPTLNVFHRLASETKADDLSTHVILLGGTGWNQVTRRFQDAISQVPITQVEDPALDSGEIFSIRRPDREEELVRPVWDGAPGDRDLVEDVAFLARIPNPFKISRTLTLCNGIHSRGVLGAVRCLTDAQVRDTNEQYLAERFPNGTFALLLRVPVVTNETLSPDLQNPHTRLFEWPPEDGVSR